MDGNAANWYVMSSEDDLEHPVLCYAYCCILPFYTQNQMAAIWILYTRPDSHSAFLEFSHQTRFLLELYCFKHRRRNWPECIWNNHILLKYTCNEAWNVWLCKRILHAVLVPHQKGPNKLDRAIQRESNGMKGGPVPNREWGDHRPQTIAASMSLLVSFRVPLNHQLSNWTSRRWRLSVL